VLLCADPARAARDLAARQLACPSCGQGRLRPWGHARERVIWLLGGATARLAPPRGRCTSCPATHVLLPSWCVPQRPHGIEVIATAAGAAVSGAGHRAIAADLGVPPATVRGWLRRLRSRAEQLRAYAARQLGSIDPHAEPPSPAGSPLADALGALAAAVHAARRIGHDPQSTWPLLGTLGLSRHLAPAPGG